MHASLSLCEVLSDSGIALACLDVFRKEPLDVDNPLLKLNDTILTPHVAGLPARPRSAITAAEEVIRVLQGKFPLYSLDKDALKRMPKKFHR